MGSGHHGSPIVLIRSSQSDPPFFELPHSSARGMEGLPDWESAGPEHLQTGRAAKGQK